MKPGWTNILLGFNLRFPSLHSTIYDILYIPVPHLTGAHLQVTRAHRGADMCALNLISSDKNMLTFWQKQVSQDTKIWGRDIWVVYSCEKFNLFTSNLLHWKATRKQDVVSVQAWRLISHKAQTNHHLMALFSVGLCITGACHSHFRLRWGWPKPMITEHKNCIKNASHWPMYLIYPAHLYSWGIRVCVRTYGEWEFHLMRI